MALAENPKNLELWEFLFPVIEVSHSSQAVANPLADANNRVPNRAALGSSTYGMKKQTMIPDKVLCEEVWKAGCPNLPILKICHQISLSPNMLKLLASCTAVSGWVSSCNHIRPWLPRRTTTIVPSFPTKASFCNMETST